MPNNITFDPSSSEYYNPSKLQVAQAHICTGNETVLLIQDNQPWDQDSDVLELEAQGKNFCIITSDQIGTTNLSNYKEIIIPSVQYPPYYENLFPGGTIHPAIAGFVINGGILSANLADYDYYVWDNYTFVGGVKHVHYASENNDIADPTHPIITGSIPCPSGNCGQILDQGYRNDLDVWYRSSHGYFTNLPAGTKTILVDSESENAPVMIEYSYGRGIVIATTTTIEWRYDRDNKKLLANEIAYQDYLASRTRGLIFSAK